MNMRTALEGTAWFSALVLAAGTWLALSLAPVQDAPTAPATPAGAAAGNSEEHVWSALGRLLERDPFTFADADEAPPSPTAESEPLPPISPPTPRPVLSGILGGAGWSAVLEAVPGRSGAVVVQAGDVLGDLHILSIAWDSVIVLTPDTTWTLTMKRPWE